MLPDRVSNPGPLTYESGALPIALRAPAQGHVESTYMYTAFEDFVLKHINIITSPDICSCLFQLTKINLCS